VSSRASDAGGAFAGGAFARVVPGRDIDGWRVGEVLHHGANGFVFAAAPGAPPGPGFAVVMKVPAIGAWQPPSALVGFETEAQVLRELTGPYVPRLAGVGDLAAVPYLVMERIEGESLATFAARAPLPAAEAAQLGAAIADALVSIHAQDVTHLDLKPENVIVRANGTCVLIDFGYAHHAHLPDLLAEGRRHAAGSAAYVSPEQLRDVRGDSRSDLFALGVILYQLVTGTLPFGEPETMAGLRDRLWRAPPPPRVRVPGVPPWLQEIVLQLLEVDPSRRHQSAAHAAFDLRHPEQVELTERGARTQAEGFARQLRRWWAMRRDPHVPVVPTRQGPVILVGVDTEHPDDPRVAAIQDATRQWIAALPSYRLMCVSVLRARARGEGEALAQTASGRHLEHTVRLRHFAAPLSLTARQLSLHVIDDADPATALLELAHANHADLVILGAPLPGERPLGWWRSTASTVTANARCSVYLARVPDEEGRARLG
jgi:nucleotide-binding universal stress UspA family protein/predicted Ser/Thr protein kinase